MISNHIPLAEAILLAGLVGLFVGSFLNVVVYRVPRGLSVAAPRSFCPRCNRQLKWWENVPVVSWIALRARCGTCHQPIPVRYPLVELATGGAFALITWGWRGTFVSAAYCALAATMLAVSLIEYGGLRAPLSVAAIGTATAQLIILVGAGWQQHWRFLGGSLIGVAVGAMAVALLRFWDPDCSDPRGHGRSALLIAGCWFGGLSLSAIAFGAGIWIVTYFIAMVAALSVTRRRLTAGAASTGRSVGPLLGAPLVSAIAVAMVVALVVGR